VLVPIAVDPPVGVSPVPALVLVVAVLVAPVLAPVLVAGAGPQAHNNHSAEGRRAIAPSYHRRDELIPEAPRQLFGAPAQIQSETDWISAIGRPPPLGICVPKQRLTPRSLSIR
jgi:hypothetical protein